MSIVFFILFHISMQFYVNSTDQTKSNCILTNQFYASSEEVKMNVNHIEQFSRKRNGSRILFKCYESICQNLNDMALELLLAMHFTLMEIWFSQRKEKKNVIKCGKSKNHISNLHNVVYKISSNVRGLDVRQ